MNLPTGGVLCLPLIFSFEIIPFYNFMVNHERNCTPNLSKFVVSDAMHNGKVVPRQFWIKLDLLTLGPVGTLVKSSSRKLMHKVFALSTLGHQREFPWSRFSRDRAMSAFFQAKMIWHMSPQLYSLRKLLVTRLCMSFTISGHMSEKLQSALARSYW